MEHFKRSLEETNFTGVTVSSLYKSLQTDDGGWGFYNYVFRDWLGKTLSFNFSAQESVFRESSWLS